MALADIGNVSAAGRFGRLGSAKGCHARNWLATKDAFGGFAGVDIVRVVIVVDEESLNSV